MRGSNGNGGGGGQESSTPYCRCRVLYLGSAVPHASKEGLLGVQEPLRELYPEQGALGARGIDSWLSVWSNGLLLENVDEHRKKVTRFFPIEALHYCAAVRHVKAGSGPDAASTRFFPLDSPFARTPSANHPPLFAAVLRRTTGIKVLECHAFICKRDMAANALVRCCFHAYADSRFAKGLEPANGPANGGASTPPDAVVANGHHQHHHHQNNNHHHHHQSTGSLYHTLGGSSTTLATSGGGGQQLDGGSHNGNSPPSSGSPSGLLKLDCAANDDDSGSLYNGDENHKVWARGRDELDGLYQEQGTLRSTRGSRQRQMIAPPPPPPPPPSQSLMGGGELEQGSAGRRKPPSAGKKLQKKLKRQAADEQQQQQMQQLYSNGHGHHTLGHHPARGYHHPRSVAGTLARPAPVLLVPAATLPRKLHHHHHHHHHHQQPLLPPPQQHHHHLHMGRAIRPISAVPVYAPLPVVPPVPPASVLYSANYGTTGNRGRRSQHHHLDQMGDAPPSGGLHRGRMAASHADLSAAGPPPLPAERSSDSPPDESRFGTGIYRRKGHLNERAFSYSIRAEHRSRSHGSLASLGFAGQQQPPPPQQQQSNGVSPKEEKKDREMAQMVAGLSLDDGLLLDGLRGQRNGTYQPHPQPLPRPKAR